MKERKEELLSLIEQLELRYDKALSGGLDSEAVDIRKELQKAREKLKEAEEAECGCKV